MPKNEPIKINDFTGIYRIMAEKANVNGGDTLDNVEASIFRDMEATYNAKNNTFIFEGDIYDLSGNLAPYGIYNEQPVSIQSYKPQIEEELSAELKNSAAVKRTKELANMLDKTRNQTVKVVRKIDGKNVTFYYNRAAMEEYVINNATDAKGNKITYFSDIPDIRKKVCTQRTKEESRKLVEFNNMINNAINAGKDYGVDPKLILAIVQREVNFRGLSDRVTGNNGKGYMQITSAPIKDMLGGYTTKKGKLRFQENLKTEEYGKEFVALLKRRGFKIDCPAAQRLTLVKDIMSYLKANKDPEFNIRLGAIILRNRLKKSNGNIQLAAQNYNGNSRRGIKYAYGKAVYNYYNNMQSLEQGNSIA